MGRGRASAAEYSTASRGGQSSAAEVRPAGPGALDGLFAPPALDGAMVARRQDGRHVHAAEDRRARVLRVLEQPGGEGFVGDRRLVDGARQQADDGIDDDQRRQLAAGQDVVADRQLEVDQRRGSARRRPRSAGTGR